MIGLIQFMDRIFVFRKKILYPNIMTNNLRIKTQLYESELSTTLNPPTPYNRVLLEEVFPIPQQFNILQKVSDHLSLKTKNTVHSSLKKSNR